MNNTSNPRIQLHMIFGSPEIVQSYEKTCSQRLFLPTHPSFDQNVNVDLRFLEENSPSDGLFEDLCKSNIVQGYRMSEEEIEEEIQREEERQMYQKGEVSHFFSRTSEKNANRCSMLDSSSEDNCIPSRKSSLSSVSSHENKMIFSTPRANSDFKEPTSTAKTCRMQEQIPSNAPSDTFADHQMVAQQAEQENLRINNKKNKHDNTPLAITSMNYNLREQKNNISLHMEKLVNLSKKQTTRQSRRDWMDSEREKHQKLQKIKKIQQIGCNCRKSKCLKMYCECFNLQTFCTQNCNCCECGNIEPTHDHQKAVLSALTRNPKAFNLESKNIQEVFDLGLELAEVRKGCKCRKTKCLKKYCECYNSGTACGKFCQCEDCANGDFS